MPTRVYECRSCGQGEERREGWDDSGPRRCPYCRSVAYHRVLFAPTTIVRGSPLVDGDRRFTRERVVANADGSETRYSSLQEARRGELERARQVLPNPEQGLARTLMARSNARKLASGVMPGRPSTEYREAWKDMPR